MVTNITRRALYIHKYILPVSNRSGYIIGWRHSNVYSANGRYISAISSQLFHRDARFWETWDQFYLYELTLIPAWIVIPSIIKCGMKLLIHFNLQQRNPWSLGMGTLLGYYLFMLEFKLTEAPGGETPYCLIASGPKDRLPASTISWAISHT